MANINTLSLKSTGSSTSRAFGGRLADVINVKDYGAAGDGIANDGVAIQAAFDAAYGPPGSPHANKWLNKGVYIPCGNYRIMTTLVLSPGGADAQGVWLVGDGQRNTRLFYDGAAVESLMLTKYMNYSRVQGITFDVTGGTAKCAIHNTGLGAGTQGGTGVSWIDCAFVGATSWGMLFDSAGLGSEQLFVNCTFEGCTGTTSNLVDGLGNPVGGGLILASANALDHIIVGCRFANNGSGIIAIAGGVNLIKGCTFSDNDDIDIWVKQQNPAPIIGCSSNSGTFCCAGPAWIVGCKHTAASGLFYDGTGTRFGQDNPKVVIEGCSVTNAVLQSNSGCSFYLRGNTFGNAGYLTGVPAPSIKENI